MNKQEMVSLLKKSVCRVKFIKADKSEREMLCTLLDEYIGVESAGRSVPNDEVVTVWDMDKDAWRAFRVDRVLEGPVPIMYKL